MANETETKTTAAAEGKKEETTPEKKTAEQEAKSAEAEAEAATPKKDEDAKKKSEADAEKENAKEPAKPAVHKTDYEKDIVYLYQFARTPLLPSVSPYCLKVETWLRLAGIKYENVDHKMKYRSKVGLLPFVELNGEEIYDSSIIIKQLPKLCGKDLDANLNQEQRTISYAMQSMIENHLSWIAYWWRAKYPAEMVKGYRINLQHMLGSRMPNGLLNFFFRTFYGRRALKRVKAQGIGSHNAEDIEEFGKQDLRTLSELLADKPFFFGDEPSTLDVVAFSLLAQIYFLDQSVEYNLRTYMLENCSNLVGLVNRVKDLCYPDWEAMCTTLDLNSHLAKPQKDEEGKKEASEDKPEHGEELEPEDKDIEKEKLDDKDIKKDEKIQDNKDKI